MNDSDVNELPKIEKYPDVDYPGNQLASIGRFSYSEESSLYGMMNTGSYQGSPVIDPKLLRDQSGIDWDPAVASILDPGDYSLLRQVKEAAEIDSNGQHYQQPPPAEPIRQDNHSVMPNKRKLLVSDPVESSTTVP
ncbi:hypothetical protein BJ085DRAFT_32071 [Dimargaris cristalligena]|uniref:Uncharacterized protein n=1 Tax=Dimargaris cristalligena TaxID=215637 RepID=A0A4P9ZNC5_9FUNG|nr:hypothetical protein BJ085DRAFT_32071 [Dimargaris cristalligena]|eukprot:RKP34101.1 hypothetical protein BJ085DRAFT_32071 [Dimargaris cristalligena]